MIRRGKIAQVGREGEVEIPGGVALFDLKGKTILPGFVNAHVHQGFDRDNLRAWARAGVTTVRDLCGPSSFSLQDQYAREPDLARLVAAGPMVSVPGGYPLVPWGSPNMLPVDSPDDARAKVRQLLAEGAQVIKIAVESGESFGAPIPSLSQAEATAIVETAHEGGTVVSAHVLVTSDLRRAQSTPMPMTSRTWSPTISPIPSFTRWLPKAPAGCRQLSSGRMLGRAWGSGQLPTLAALFLPAERLRSEPTMPDTTGPSNSGCRSVSWIAAKEDGLQAAQRFTQTTVYKSR